MSEIKLADVIDLPREEALPIYEKLTVNELNALNDEFDRDIVQVFLAKREILNSVRKRKIEESRLADRMEALYRDPSEMTVEEMKAVEAKVKLRNQAKLRLRRQVMAEKLGLDPTQMNDQQLHAMEVEQSKKHRIAAPAGEEQVISAGVAIK